MSVINQMLKDLDDRKKDNQSPAAAAYTASQYVSGQKVSLVKVISLVIFIVFLVVLITTVTIYKFDIFNTNQDTTIESALSQKDNVSESGKETVKSKEAVSNEQVNIKDPDSKVMQKVETDEPVSTEAAVTEDATEEFPKTEKDLTSDSNNIEQKVVVTEENSSEQEATKVIKSTVKTSLNDQSKKLFNQAQRNVDRGDSLQAKQQLLEALNLNLKNHKARILLLTILLSSGEINEMQQLLDSSLNQWPAINEYRQLQARLYLEKGDQQQALSILQQDIPAIEQSIDYHALLAFVAQQLQQDKLASKHFRLLLQVNNSRADWWLGFAVSEERLGHNDIALQAYNQSIRRTGLSEKVKNYARQRIQVIQGY